MRKFTLTLLLTLALLIGAAIPAVAQEDPAENVTDLAAYVPATTSAFISLRTDQAYFETLNSLLTRVAEAGGESVPPGGLLAVIDQGLAAETDGELDYDSAVRSWLGDSAALAILTDDINRLSEDLVPAVVMLSVTDQASAERFVDLVIASEQESNLYDKSRTGDAIGWRSTEPDAPVLLLTEDVLFIGTAAAFEIGLGEAYDVSLADSDSFMSLTGTLPADSYNIVGFLDLRALIESASMLVAALAGNDLNVNAAALPQAFGPVGFGATILGDRTLALDLVHLPGEGDLLAVLNLPALSYVETPAADPDFARFAPADSVFYIQGTGLGQITEAVRGDLAVVGNALLQDWILPVLETEEPEAYAALRDFDVDRFNTFIDLTLEGTLDMTAEEVYAAIDGQNAQAVRIGPGVGEVPVSLESVQLIESVDADLSQRLLDGLAQFAEDFGLLLRYEDGQLVVETTDNFALVLGGFSGSYVTEIVTALSDEVLAAGDPDLVAYALAPSGDSLLDSEAFQAESGFFIEGAQSLWLVNFAPLRDLLAEDGPLREEFPFQDFSGAQRLLATFQSMAISAASDGESNILRMTVSFTEPIGE